MLPPHPPIPRPPRKPRKPKAATVPKPPTRVRQEKGNFYEEPYPGYKKPADLQAQAHQQAVDAQAQDVATYQQQLAQIAANASAKSSWQQQVGAALAQALAGLGPPLAKMGKQFGASQRDFASSLVAGMGAELGADAGGDNAILGAIDAPAGQAVGGSAGAAGDVLFATGGDIPATQMEGVGAAMAQELGAFPQIALNTAKNQMWATNQAAAQDSQGPQSALQKLAQDQPSLAQEYYDQLVKEQQGYQTDYEKEKKDRRDTVLQLYNMGLATQQDVAYAMGLPDWKRYPKTGKQTATKTSKRHSVHYADGSYGSVDDQGNYYNARGQRIDPGVMTKPMVAKPTRYAKATINGRVVLYDPTDPSNQIDMGRAGSPTAKAAQKVNMPLSRSLGYWSDDSGHPVKALANVPPPTQTSGLKPSAPPKPLRATAAQMAQARQTLSQVGRGQYYAGGRSLTTSDLKSIVSTYNAQAKANGYTQINLANLYAMTPDELSHLGISKKAMTPQSAYLKMVELGVPARQAWAMVRRKYPKWGAGYFSPKGSAAAETAGSWPAPIQYAKIIGYPHQGTHTLYGNWQSDNAIDIAMPKGTPLYAVSDGVIGSRIGALPGNDPRLQGLRLTIEGPGNSWYYAHLSKLAVRAGQRVRKGQLIGYSGEANGTAHLHIASENGSPIDILSSKPQTVANTGGNSAGRTPMSAKTIAKNLAANYGWSGAEWRALAKLGQLESGWKYTARNPSSGALGIGQALGHDLPEDYATNPLTQIQWMLNYIKERYGSPSKALAFWYSDKPANMPQGHWY